MQIGLDPNEGVEVAIWPGEPDSAELGTPFPLSPGVEATPVFATIPTWGRRLLDIITEPAVEVRWWKVRDYARTNKLDLVPVSWQGAAQDIPEKYFAEEFLGIRLWSEGPWFWPMKVGYLEDNLKILAGFSNSEGA